MMYMNKNQSNAHSHIGVITHICIAYTGCPAQSDAYNEV